MQTNEELLNEAIDYANDKIKRLDLKFESEIDKGAFLSELTNAYWFGATKAKTEIWEKMIVDKFEKENNDNISKDDEETDEIVEIIKLKMFIGTKKEIETKVNDFFEYAFEYFDYFEIISSQINYCGENYDESLLYSISLIYKYR